MLQSKIIPPAELLATVAAIRAEGRSIVTLNGSFDLLHAGHLYILTEAAKQADVLIVALNSDESIKQYKSPLRPIIPLKYRLQMMAALECIDFVTWFDETDPRRILSLIKPDVHANGAEYGPDCLEKDIVEENGGKIHIVDRIPGLATSDVIKKILEIESAPCG